MHRSQKSLLKLQLAASRNATTNKQTGRQADMANVPYFYVDHDDDHSNSESSNTLRKVFVLNSTGLSNSTVTTTTSTFEPTHNGPVSGTTTTTAGPLKFAWEPPTMLSLGAVFVMSWWCFVIYKRKWTFDHIDRNGQYESLAASHRVSVRNLGTLRLLIGTYALGVLTICLVYSGWPALSYFTLWNYTTLTLYFLVW